MHILFDLVTSLFRLPINPLYEYLIFVMNGLIAFFLAYKIAGRLGTDSSGRRGLHWFFRIAIFVGLWIITRFVIWVISLFR